jgi:hypothetical protein
MRESGTPSSGLSGLACSNTMSPRCLSPFALALYAGCVAAEPPPPAVIVNHSRQVAPARGPQFRSFPKGTMPQTDAWQGLYCDASGCEIGEATVAVMSGTLADCADGDAYAETVFAPGNPVALFSGLALPTGKVATVLLAKKAPDESAHFSRLRKLGLWQTRLKDQTLELSWVRLPRPKAPDEAMYRYHFVSGNAKQFFFSSFGPIDGEKGGSTTPFVHWAGDLDGDGKLDLLVEIPYGMAEDDEARCEVAYRLYLSSSAREGEILHKVAQTTGTQPDCVCRKEQRPGQD